METLEELLGSLFAGHSASRVLNLGEVVVTEELNNQNRILAHLSCKFCGDVLRVLEVYIVRDLLTTYPEKVMAVVWERCVVELDPWRDRNAFDSISKHFMEKGELVWDEHWLGRY